MATSPFVLIILDGWGHREQRKDNAIAQASKPFFDGLWQKYPHTFIDCSGPAVGLPKGVMGNSEVGHMNLGAGRIVYTGLSRIYHAIEDGSFFKNPALLKAVEQVNRMNGTLHLMGLLSDGAVHSHQDHLYALLQLAKINHVAKVAIHCFMDGRDTPPHDGPKYIEGLLSEIREVGTGEIASLAGRYYAMDRDKHWDRIEQAFRAVCGKSQNRIENPQEYLQKCYQNNLGDEFIPPATVVKNSGAVATVSGHDAVIFFNFRADRARQITRVFSDKSFKDFDRQDQPLPAVFVCAAPYDKTLNLPTAFEPSYPQKILPEILSRNGLTQLRLAETEKYAHVTFFFNGGRDTVFDGEERVLIPSPREVPTYDQKPEMSAPLIKDEFIKRLGSQRYNFILLNFANTDMVGHTAVPQAMIRAVEVVDDCLSQIVPKVLEQDGDVMITADHGNAEEMRDSAGKAMTAHTTNLVPLILAAKKHLKTRLKCPGRLCDVAPTILELMNIKAPPEMTGKSLVSYD